MPDTAQNRRTSDKVKFWTCWLADRFSELWDFIDKRDIDKHAYSWLVGACAWEVTRWGMAFAEAHPDLSGAEMAMVLAAVGGPMALYGGAVTSWYFKRQD